MRCSFTDHCHNHITVGLLNLSLKLTVKRKTYAFIFTVRSHFTSYDLQYHSLSPVGLASCEHIRVHRDENNVEVTQLRSIFLMCYIK